MVLKNSGCSALTLLADPPLAGLYKTNQMPHLSELTPSAFPFNPHQGIGNRQPVPEQNFVGLPQRSLGFLGHTVALEADLVNRPGLSRIPVRHHERRDILYDLGTAADHGQTAFR